MNVGDRALALLDPSDRALLAAFLALVPRYLRAEVDELVVAVHPLPTLEKRFLAVVRSLVASADPSAASDEACQVMAVALRQLGRGAPAAGSGSGEREASGEGLRRLEALLELRPVLNGRATGRPGW
jgi:hypothetical protein